MIRVWGGGNPETEDFFALCDELGIMVWEDFPVANQETSLYPQDVWEAQVLHIIFSLRNHPSLAVWCGGNEFNPYSFGNATVTGVTERSVRDFDGTRLFTRATPDPGDFHPYVNFDPTWYGHVYRLVPFVSETGILNMPEPQSILEVVDAHEFDTPVWNIFSKEYWSSHPEFFHHFQEPEGARTLWSRATQIDDLSAPNLDTFCEALEVAAGEFTQITSDQIQANYPVTTGLMPWSLTVPWPLVYLTFIDGLDQATASYYFPKRTDGADARDAAPSAPDLGQGRESSRHAAATERPAHRNERSSFGYRLQCRPPLDLEPRARRNAEARAVSD